MVAVLLLAGTLVAARYRIEELREAREADLEEPAPVPLSGAAQAR
jgi:hypothetical protein